MTERRLLQLNVDNGLSHGSDLLPALGEHLVNHVLRLLDLRLHSLTPLLVSIDLLLQRAHLTVQLEDLHGLPLHVDDELLDCVGEICVGKDLSEVKFLVVYD